MNKSARIVHSKTFLSLSGWLVICRLTIRNRYRSGMRWWMLSCSSSNLDPLPVQLRCRWCNCSLDIPRSACHTHDMGSAIGHPRSGGDRSHSAIHRSFSKPFPKFISIMSDKECDAFVLVMRLNHNAPKFCWVNPVDCTSIFHFLLLLSSGSSP